MNDKFLNNFLSDINEDDRSVTVIYPRKVIAMAEMLGAKWGKSRSDVLRKALQELLEREGLINDEI